MTTTIEAAPGHRKKFDVWKVAYVVLIMLALITRLYALGDRAVSHDETTHAKYSWNLYSGSGFRHDPLMHGPLLFEVTALFYGLFGVSDFTARLYAALAGVALVAAPWLLRRWMGRLGALLASVMVLISPTITYYSRYTRHDIPLLLFITLLLWSILQYLDRESGGGRWLIWMGIFFALTFATKENAYMYTALFLVLMALPLVWQLFRVRWERPSMVSLIVVLLALGLMFGTVFLLVQRSAPVVAEGETNNEIGAVIVPVWGRVALGCAVLSVAGAMVGLVHGVGEAHIRRLRLFDVLLVLVTFTLPLGSALLMNLIAGVDMTSFYQALMSANFSSVPWPSLVGAFVTLAIALGVSVAAGLWWDRRSWPVIALAYYGVFFVLYSTFFTYGWGALSGLVGGLAYWIAQQGVERGSQPWYYYGLIGSLYEYLPLLVSSVGLIWIAVRASKYMASWAGSRTKAASAKATAAPPAIATLLPRLWPLFLAGWAVLSWGAYIVAGEKMPWLFTHIAYPHILLTAWFLGKAFGETSLRDLLGGSGWLVPVSLIFGALALGAFRQSSGALQQLLQEGLAAPSLELLVAQLQPLGKTIGGLAGIVLFSGLLFSAMAAVGLRHSLRLAALTIVAVLGGLTLRTMVMAAFINDEMATEFIVYAHSTPDVKEVLDQVEEISWRLTGTPDQIQVAYGKDTAWPFYWYMYTRFPNNYYFETPEADRLLASPVIIAARSEWESVEAIIGAEYDSYDYRHIWWPVEDYKNLTWEKVQLILTEPARRSAIWDIAWKRDYTRYAKLRNPDDPFTLVTWPHRVEFRFYVRRDLATQIWAYQMDAGRIQDADERALPLGGSAVSDVPLQTYETPVVAVANLTLQGTTPTGLAVASDGSIYVVDRAGHQIWHMGSRGDILGVWGGYGAAPGQFNQPADVGVDAEGYVYVADTWNHRIQKFAPDTVGFDGEPLVSWGRFARVTANDAGGWGAFFGPRGIDVGPDGNIYVTDTGNNRVQVFDAQGQFLRVFGSAGDGIGQLKEPVGIAVGADGEIYVADTWNRRIQVFNADGLPIREWEVPVWGNLRLDDRPALAVRGGLVVATDPAYQRILVYDAVGEPLQVLVDAVLPQQPGGVAIVADGVMVSDLAGEQVGVYPLPMAP